MEYFYTVIILIGLYVVLASSFNLIIGYGGLISIAHPVFYAIGAYTSALLSRDFGVPIIASMFIGAAVAVIASIALALPSLRVSGDYLLIASIGFQLGLLEVIKNVSWTGGAGGLTNIPSFLVQSVGRETYVALVVVVAVLSVWLVRSIAHGPYGRALSAMRDDELAYSALGRNAIATKVSVFRARVRSRRLRWGALCPLFPLHCTRAVRDSSVGGDPHYGRRRRHALDVGPGGRRGHARGFAAGHYFSQLAAERARSVAGTAVYRPRTDLHVPAAARPCARRRLMARYRR